MESLFFLRGKRQGEALILAGFPPAFGGVGGGVGCHVSRSGCGCLSGGPFLEKVPWSVGSSSCPGRMAPVQKHRRIIECTHLNSWFLLYECYDFRHFPNPCEAQFPSLQKERDHSASSMGLLLGLNEIMLVRHLARGLVHGFKG